MAGARGLSRLGLETGRHGVQVDFGAGVGGGPAWAPRRVVEVAATKWSVASTLPPPRPRD